MSDMDALRIYVQDKFCENVGLSRDDVFGPNLSLARIISRSKRMTNSIDLMEAFARTSNAVRKEHGVRIRLPALSLDTPISNVLDIFVREAKGEQGKAP